MKAIKIFFILFLCILPFGEIGRLQLTNDVAVHLNDVMLFFILGAWIIFSKTKIKQIIGIQLFKPLLLFSCLALLSLFINMYKYTQIEILVAFLYLARWLGYAMLFFVVGSFDVLYKKKIVYGMVVLGVVTVGLGYVQYFFYPNLRNLYYAGWDEHLFRMFSTFLDPNFAGAFFVMYFMFVLGLIFQKRFWTSQNDGKRAFLLCGIAVVTFGAIVLTYSRSAYLMFGVSLFVFLLLQRQKKLLFGLLGLSLLFPILFFFSPKSEGTNLFRTTSSFARVAAFQNAFTLWRENPVFGVGFNTYRYAQEKHGFLVQTEKENHAGAGTDNSFLFVLATTGVVGFGVYVYLWHVIIREMLKRVRHDKKRSWTSQDDSSRRARTVNIVMLSSIAGLLVNAMFINSLFYPPIMAFLWIELGLITDYKQR